MQQKKTKLDFFIEAYASYGLQSEAKEVVSSHVQYLKASKALTKAKAKHGAAFIAETMKGAKFAPVFCDAENRPVKPVFVSRAVVAPDFNEQLATLIKIKADKKKTLASRSKKLSSMYNTKLAKPISSVVASHIGEILAAFESASNNLTFKPPMAFHDTLSDVRTTLNSYQFARRELWQDFKMPDSQLLRSVQSTPVLEWFLGEGPKAVFGCFKAIAKTYKSSNADDIAKFDVVIDKLEKALCERLYQDLNGKLVRNVNDPVEPPWLTDVDMRDIVRGEYVVAEIGAESVPVKMLNAREELARELSETDVRLSYSLESEVCRSGIFANIKAMTRELESGLAAAVDKTDFLISFFTKNRTDYLQAFLDRAIAAAIKGKGAADKQHLTDLNSLLVSYSVMASPNNGESRIVGVMGASELTHYIKFVCPWLSYKANDGGWHESSKWEGLATSHKGQGFPVVGSDNVCLYPPISLMRYLTIKKTVQAQVRITNRARKRHNENLAKGK